MVRAVRSEQEDWGGVVARGGPALLVTRHHFLRQYVISILLLVSILVACCCLTGALSWFYLSISRIHINTLFHLRMLVYLSKIIIIVLRLPLVLASFPTVYLGIKLKSGSIVEPRQSQVSIQNHNLVPPNHLTITHVSPSLSHRHHLKITISTITIPTIPRCELQLQSLDLTSSSTSSTFSS